MILLLELLFMDVSVRVYQVVRVSLSLRWPMVRNGHLHVATPGGGISQHIFYFFFVFLIGLFLSSSS